MNIRIKLLLIVFVTLVFTIVLLYYAVSNIMIKSYLEIENHNAEIKINSVIRSFAQICEDYSNKINDWAVWDSTYDFMLDKNPLYVKTNISYESMRLLKLDFVFFVNCSNEIILDCCFDYGRQKILNADERFKIRILEIADILSSKDKKTETSHLFSIGSRPAMVASNLVLTSSGAGPPRGYLIYGHFIDGSDIEKIGKLTALGLSYVDILDDFANTSEVSPQARGLEINYSVHKALTPESMNCNILFYDVNVKPLFIIKFQEPRNINQQFAIIKYFAAALLITSLLFLQ